MKKTIICLLMSIVTFSLSAQKLKPKWGSPQKAESKYYDPSIVGEDEDFIYTYDLRKEELTLEKIDKKSLKRKYIKILDLPTKGKLEYDFEGINYVNGQFVLFASTYIRKQKKMELRVFVIDGKKPKYTKDFELFENDVEKKRRRGAFDVHVSKNKEMILVHYVAYYKKKDHTKEEFKLLDKDLNVALEKAILIPGRSNGNASNFHIDEEGSVYFKRGFEIVVFDATQDYDEWSQPINLEESETGSSIGDFSLTLNTDNDMVLVGSYRTVDANDTDEKKRRRERKEGDTQIEGMFYMKIDGLSKETVISKLNTFDEEFIKEFRSRRDIKKGREAEVNSVTGYAKFFYKDDGGLVLMSEHRYVFSDNSTNGGGTNGEDYYYLEMLAFNFSAEGEMLWAKRLPKAQRFYWRTLYGPIKYGTFGFSFFVVPFDFMNHFSYIAGLSGDNLFIIYNDHKKNKGKKRNTDRLREMKKVKSAVPAVYTIDLESGKVKKTVNSKLSQGKLRLKPSTYYQSSQVDPLYILIGKKKNYQFGVIDLSKAEVKNR